jgi:RNA polymerase sigma factor (sigma-70 family)
MGDQHLSEEALESLLARTCAGDLIAQNELFNHAFNPLAKMAARLLSTFPVVRRQEEAGDILGDAVCRLLPALLAVKPATMGAFFSLARVQILRELLDRARYCAAAGPLHALEERTLEEICDANWEPKDLERWTALQEGIEQLPVAQREAVSLRLHHRLTEAEIAEIFQVGERTIQQRWQSAAAKLNEALRGGGVELGNVSLR